MVRGTETVIEPFFLWKEKTLGESRCLNFFATGIERGEAVAPEAGKVTLAASEVPGSTEMRVPLPSLQSNRHRYFKKCF